MIELTPESKFELEGIAVSLKRLAIINPEVLNRRFISDNRFILNEESLVIVRKIRNRVRNKILILDKYRKEREKEKQNQGYYCSSSNIKMNDYNYREVREYVCHQILYGI